MAQSVLNRDVSCFATCDSVVPKTVNLLTWLTSEKYKDKVVQIRQIQDEATQKKIKTSLPAVTPSGRFEYRNAEHLIEHSGLLTFDIDLKDNRHITNFQDMRNQLSYIPNVAYCGLSVRGKGFWGVVPIPQSTPDIHSKRFQALQNDFKEIGIVIDPSCKDVCRLRIYSFDPDAYFNHNAKLYTKIFIPAPKKSTRPASSDTRDKVESIISEISSTGIDITGTYDDWFALACSLANEFGESGRGYFHSISKYHPEYSVLRTDRMFDAVLKKSYNKISIGSFFHVARDYGLIKESSPCFREAESGTSTPVKVPTDTYTRVKVTKPNTGVNCVIKSGPWSSEIEELQRFFDSVTLPKEYRLDQCTRISNIPTFLESHLNTIKYQNGNQRYLPYLDRLRTFKKLLKDEQQN